MEELSDVKLQRLRFLESRLFWEGAVNRRDVCEAFGITPNHFTREMSLYKTHFPENAWYDEVDRVYRPRPEFSPGFISGDPGEHLALLRANSQSSCNALQRELGGDAPCDSLRPPEGRISISVLRGVMAAVHDKTCCSIQYQSFSRPEIERREIWPHALAWAGDRWHVRAFDSAREKYIDLVLVRIKRLKSTTRQLPSVAGVDIDWEEREAVEVVPNPKLSAGQKEVIAKEYGMTKSKGEFVWRVELRRCLIPYFLYRYRLDEDRSKQTRNGFPIQRIVLRDISVRAFYSFHDE